MKRGQITAATPVSGVKTIDHSRRPVPPERQDRHVRAANSCGVAVIGSALTAVADDSGQPKPGKDLDRCHQLVECLVLGPAEGCLRLVVRFLLSE